MAHLLVELVLKINKAPGSQRVGSSQINKAKYATTLYGKLTHLGVSNDQYLRKYAHNTAAERVRPC